MTSGEQHERRILESWFTNANPWTSTVREGLIASRALVTDQAIIDAVMERAPTTVLDVGCGEGWLARALNKKNIAVTGIDVVPELIFQATQVGGGDFRVVPYDDLESHFSGETFDVVICNFSLLGNESVEQVLAAAPSLLNSGGALIVQTLHPISACGDRAYEDGWREGSWAGFDPAFTDPAPWYFRTLESWAALFPKHGLRLLEQREPVHPVSGIPASVVFIACAAREPR
jgi:2-polyprenyl-3-methyl-5-hydroxy-6-metoxy-1,4-benzoquinol methylase